MKEAECPLCGKVIQLKKQTKVRQLITCPYCRSLLELVHQSPPTLDWVEDPLIYSPRMIFTKRY
jgi:C4-type Zn-finger protein